MRRNSRGQHRAEHQPAGPPHAGRFVRPLRQAGNKLPGFFERQGRVLTRHLCQLARERHEKFQGTFYHLEPNVKETPGGLRDLHLIDWLGKLRKPDEEVAGRLVAPTRFVHSLRCFLHYQTRRDQNLLSFDAQEALTTQPYLSLRGTRRSDARVFSQRTRDLQRSPPRAGSERAGRKLAGDAFPRLALAPLKLGIHGFERADLSAIAGAIDRRSGHCSPPVGIRRASWHPVGCGNRTPRGASL